MLVRIANWEDPALFVYSLFGSQLVFKILEHLPYWTNMGRGSLKGNFTQYNTRIFCWIF